MNNRNNRIKSKDMRQNELSHVPSDAPVAAGLSLETCCGTMSPLRVATQGHEIDEVGRPTRELKPDLVLLLF